MWAGYLGAAALWYACVAWLPLESFRRLPDPVAVLSEWLSPQPTYGISIFTAAYYKHMLYSTWRATAAFTAATLLGVPLGIGIGWSSSFSGFASALLGMLRPVPPLAWVPLAILIFHGSEAAVVFVTFLVAFFATPPNTAGRGESVEPGFFPAPACPGAGRRDTLPHVGVPGALPRPL